MTKLPCIYILTNRKDGALYIGVTSNILHRVKEHQETNQQGFTKKYNLHSLVYYEFHETMESAIIREKKLKKWKREYKIQLIQKNNPDWDDLSQKELDFERAFLL